MAMGSHGWSWRLEAGWPGTAVMDATVEPPGTTGTGTGAIVGSRALNSLYSAALSLTVTGSLPMI